MANSIKLKNNNYLDSSGIVFKRTSLEDILTYSTTERIIGKWINNKPIYRKVINLSSISSTNTDIYTNTGINNLDEVINMYGLHKFSLGWIPWNFHNQIYTQYSIVTYLRNNNNNYQICQRSQFTTNGGYAIVEYTKTTD